MLITYIAILPRCGVLYKEDSAELQMISRCCEQNQSFSLLPQQRNNHANGT